MLGGWGVKNLGFLFRMFYWTSVVSICWGRSPGGLFFFFFVCRSLVAPDAWAGDWGLVRPDQIRSLQGRVGKERVWLITRFRLAL